MVDILRKFYRNQYRFQKIKILGRVACLGSEIINGLGLQKSLVNHQKSRVDFLLEISNNPKIKPIAKNIYQFLERTYIAGTIQQQESDFFSYKKPDLIFMDSFSELTDQMFIEKNSGKKFLANYSDLKHDENFVSRYDNNGLLSIEDLYQNYDLFFNKVSNIYPNIRIIFIHFPTILDARDKFRERGDIILDVINQLSVKYSFLQSIALEDNFIKKSNDQSDELKDFPYHYGNETYEKFLDKVKKSLYV